MSDGNQNFYDPSYIILPTTGNFSRSMVVISETLNVAADTNIVQNGQLNDISPSLLNIEFAYGMRNPIQTQNQHPRQHQREDCSSCRALQNYPRNMMHYQAPLSAVRFQIEDRPVPPEEQHRFDFTPRSTANFNITSDYDEMVQQPTLYGNGVYEASYAPAANGETRSHFTGRIPSTRFHANSTWTGNMWGEDERINYSAFEHELGYPRLSVESAPASQYEQWNSSHSSLSRAPADVPAPSLSPSAQSANSETVSDPIIFRNPWDNTLIRAPTPTDVPAPSLSPNAQSANSETVSDPIIFRNPWDNTLIRAPTPTDMPSSSSSSSTQSNIPDRRYNPGNNSYTSFDRPPADSPDLVLNSGAPAFCQLRSPSGPFMSGGLGPAPASTSPISPFASPLAQHWGSPRSIQESPAIDDPHPDDFSGGNYGLYRAPSVERELSPDLYGASPPRRAGQPEESPDLYGASPPRRAGQPEESPDLYGASPLLRTHQPSGLQPPAPIDSIDNFSLPSPAVHVPSGNNASPRVVQNEIIKEDPTNPLISENVDDYYSNNSYFTEDERAVQDEVSSTLSRNEEMGEVNIKEEEAMENIREEVMEEAIKEEEVMEENIKEEVVENVPRPLFSPTSEELSDESMEESSHDEDDLPEHYDPGTPLPTYESLGPPPPRWPGLPYGREEIENRIRDLENGNSELEMLNRRRESILRTEHLHHHAFLDAPPYANEMQRRWVIGLEQKLEQQLIDNLRVTRDYERQTQELQAMRARIRQYAVEHERLRTMVLEAEQRAHRMEEQLEGQARMRIELEVRTDTMIRREAHRRADITRLQTENNTLSNDNRRLKRRMEEIDQDERYRQERNRTLGEQMETLNMARRRTQEELETQESRRLTSPSGAVQLHPRQKGPHKR
ncbi:hypothetical protein ACMFMG_003162 [Clarireedia jacksonii]